MFTSIGVRKLPGIALSVWLSFGLTQASAHPTTMAGVPRPIPCRSCWQPPVHLTWQLQLGGTLDTKPVAAMYEIDMFDDSARQVTSLHRLGRKVICYIDAGSWEKWRPDAGSYPHSVLGKPLDGWPGERWVDIRKLSILKPILRKRVLRCRAKGFDGVDFDNVDGYQNPTGFHLTAAEQLRFNVFLANLAHANHLTVLLKNDPDQARKLQPYFNGAVVEQCFQYQECDSFLPFVRHRKPVFEVEYSLAKAKFCAKAQRLRFNAMKKHLALGPWLSRC
jgi:hypothetical protein